MLIPSGLTALGIVIAAAVYIGYQPGVPRYILAPAYPPARSAAAPPNTARLQSRPPGSARSAAGGGPQQPPTPAPPAGGEVQRILSQPTAGRADPFAPLVLVNTGAEVPLPPPPSGLPLPEAGAPARSELPAPGTGMRVTGIMGGRARVAIVETEGNSYIVGRGDRIGDAVVQAVLADRVVLTQHGATFALSIGFPGRSSVAAVSAPVEPAPSPQRRSPSRPPAAAQGTGSPAQGPTPPASRGSGGGQASQGKGGSAAPPSSGGSSAGQQGAGGAPDLQAPPPMPTGTKVFTPTFYGSSNSGSTGNGSSNSSPSSPSSTGQPSGTGEQGRSATPSEPGGAGSGNATSGGSPAANTPGSAGGQAMPPSAPAPAPRPAVTPTAVGETGPAAPEAPAPSSSGAGRLYQITAGPIYGQRRAEDIARRLSTSGSAVGVTMKNLGTLTHYRVVSEPLLPAIAARRAAALPDIHPQQEALPDGRVKLLYGDFGSEQPAAALRATIRTRGYSASIETARAPAYSATVLTPFQKAAVDRSIAIIKSGGDVPVEVQPIQ